MLSPKNAFIQEKENRRQETEVSSSKYTMKRREFHSQNQENRDVALITYNL
ncbi:MAG: hypothetical protein ACXWDO_06580 [Bacteroidia bacterium]